MAFLALELWPYMTAALALGFVTGWLSGCRPRPALPEIENAPTAPETSR